MEVKALYRNRFSGNNDMEKKNLIWKVLCNYFFQKYIKPDYTVVDIAAGYCEFINNIHAKKKIAIDINPDVHVFANEDIEIFNCNVKTLASMLTPNTVDVFFVSNFLEHLEKREDITELFLALRKMLKKNGMILILQPNIKYTGEQYWDFFDHKLPLTDTALIEAAKCCDLETTFCIKKFLPFTTKSNLPQHPILVWLYLKLMPFSGMIFGAQSFLVVQNNGTDERFLEN